MMTEKQDDIQPETFDAFHADIPDTSEDTTFRMRINTKLYKQAQEFAKKDHRTFRNLVEYLLDRYMNGDTHKPMGLPLGLSKPMRLSLGQRMIISTEKHPLLKDERFEHIPDLLRAFMCVEFDVNPHEYTNEDGSLAFDKLHDKCLPIAKEQDNMFKAFCSILKEAPRANLDHYKPSR